MPSSTEKLRSGTLEARLAATAKYFGKTPTTVKSQIRFWWSGSKYLREFGDSAGANHRRWDMPTDRLLTTLNENGSVSRTAKALGTTPITLTKALARKGIVLAWVLRKK